MKQTLKKYLCILTAVILLCASLLTPVASSAATEFSYPDGISAEKAQEIVASTDTLLLKAVQTASGKTLAQQVMPVLYESNLLGMLTVGIYTALSDEQMAEMLATLSVSVTPADLAAVLYAYPEVSAALKSASSWETADLSDVSWNINNKNEFAAAVGTVLSPLYPLLQFLLCEGSFEIVGKLIKANGGNGYETAIIPLFEVFGCKEYLSYADYKKQADANTQAAGANLILPLLNHIEKMLASPLSELCSMLPNLGYFIIRDGFENTINTLLAPVTQLMEKIEKIPLLNSALAGSGIGNLSTDFAGNVVPDINTILQDSDMKITLPEIDWELLASCGTVSGNTVTADKGKTFVVVFRWLWEALQSNSDSLAAVMSEGLAQTEAAAALDVSVIFDAFLQDDADKVIKALAFMLKPNLQPEDMYWSFGTVTTTAFAFTQDMPRENYAKMIDGFDNLLGSLIAEMMGSASLKNAVRSGLYTNDNITALLKMLYTALSSEEIAGILSVLGTDTSVAAVLNGLTEEQYKDTVTFLKRFKNWDEFPENGLSWGFEDGDRDGFAATCAAVLRPFGDLFAFLLAGENFVLLDSITICGGNGYNNAVIPLFEALGMDPTSYKSFSEYKSGTGTDQLLTDILNPLLAHVESICAAPVTYLTEQLPTICYFISDGGLQKMLYAVAIPLLNFIQGSRLSVDVMSLMEEIAQFDLTFGEEQVNELLTQLQNSENGQSIALPPIPALTEIASLGTVKTIDSKRTFKGKASTFNIVEADKESVLAYIVDFMVSLMQMPENSNLLMGTFTGGAEAGADNPFAAYTDTFAAEMEGMSHDEMVKWFYDMLVFESDEAITDSDLPTEIPHIIYEPEDEKSGVSGILVFIIAAGIAAGIVVLVRKKQKRKPADAAKQAETEETEE